MNKKMGFLMLVIVMIIVMPLVFNPNASYDGADGKAVDAIKQIAPNSKPWFSPIWEPPSAEIESLLFSLQAALGSGFICYYLGYQSGKKKGKDLV